MKIHKPTVISLAFLAAVYLVMQWRGNTASVEKNSQSSSETQTEATKSDKEKGVNEAETSSENTTPEVANPKAVYTAYLTLLKERQKDIEAYTWQAYEEDKDGAPISVETKGIAVADVYGDSGPLALLAALLLKKPLKKRLKKFDAKQYGGAPILGLKGLVIKVHGNTDGKEVTTAIKQAKEFVEKKLTKKIAEAIDFKEVEE